MAILPVLKRFDIFVYKPMPGEADLRIPAADVPIRFYAQGATIQTASTISGELGATSPLFVYHGGEIAVGDELTIDPRPTGTGRLYVNLIEPYVPPSTDLYRLTVTNLDPQDGTYEAPLNARAIITSKLLTVYQDPLGVTAGASSLTTDSRGRATGYIRNLRYDYTVTLGSNNAIASRDAEGSFVMRC